MSNPFSFDKAPSSSGATSGSLFGSAGAPSTSSGGGLFGNVGAGSAGSAGSSSPSLFGAGATGSKAPLFSTATGSGNSTPTFSFGTAQGTSTTSGSLFGGPASQTPNKPGESPASTSTSSLFSSAKPTGGLFGNTTATPAQPTQNSLFGNQPSTTPAGPPPQGNAPSQGPSMFGQGTQKPGGLFATGSTSSAPSAPSTTTAPLFGATPSTGNSLFKPAAEQKSLFGTTPTAPNNTAGLITSSGQAKPAESTTPASIAPATSKPTFSLTNTSTAPSSATTATSSATPQKSVFPSLGNTAASATPTSTPAAAPSGGLFAGLNVAKPADATSTTKPTAAGGLFAEPAESTPSTTQPTTSTPAATTGTTTATKPPLTATSGPAPTNTTPATTATTTAGAKGPTLATAPGIPNLGASTAGPTPPAQSRLKNKTMDEIITRWATDLTKYQKDFREQAEKVADWDRMLVENASKVQKLYGNTVDAERATQEVERQLASVEGQQDELSSWLDRYEREVDEMMSKQVGPGESLQGPDQERERTYKLAEKLSERIDEMGKDLSSMIDEVNSASATLSKTNKADEPISQIVRILNSHLSQLQSIDQGTTELQAKVSAAQKAGQAMSSRFGHGFSNSGMGNGSAADDFYRSYMGRR